MIKNLRRRERVDLEQKQLIFGVCVVLLSSSFAFRSLALSSQPALVLLAKLCAITAELRGSPRKRRAPLVARVLRPRASQSLGPPTTGWPRIPMVSRAASSGAVSPSGIESCGAPPPRPRGSEPGAGRVERVDSGLEPAGGGPSEWRRLGPGQPPPRWLPQAGCFVPARRATRPNDRLNALRQTIKATAKVVNKIAAR